MIDASLRFTRTKCTITGSWVVIYRNQLKKTLAIFPHGRCEPISMSHQPTKIMWVATVVSKQDVPSRVCSSYGEMPIMTRCFCSLLADDRWDVESQLWLTMADPAPDKLHVPWEWLPFNDYSCCKWNATTQFQSYPVSHRQKATKHWGL